MKRAVKISLCVLIGLIMLLLIASISFSFYVRQHKARFVSFLVSEAEKGLNGATLHIGDISMGLKSSFPLISLTIDSVYLRDSLWSRHHHDLAKVNRVYATIDFWQLFRGKIDIVRLDLDKPDIYFYTDSLGYSNTSVFRKRTKSIRDTVSNRAYPTVAITNARFTIDEGVNHKFFGFRINKLEGKIRRIQKSQILSFDLNLDCLVQAMTFNDEKGSFLENKPVQGSFRVLYNRESRVLDFEKIPLEVDHQPFVFTGKFFFAQEKKPFLLSWETSNLSFRKAASFLSTSIQKKLEVYDIEDPISSLTGSLDNRETQYANPLIHLWLKVEDRKIKSPFLAVDHASFTATFNNEARKFRGHEDSNTVIHFSGLQGEYENLKFHSDSVVLTNLIHPRIKTSLISDFNLDMLNGILKENKLVYKGGTGKIDLAYSGSLEKMHDSSRLINGTISLHDAGIQYLPKNLLFNPVSGFIRFTGKNMSVENLVFHAGKSDIKINGEVKSIFYFINHLNEKASLDWTLTSNRLHLEDFSNLFQSTSNPEAAKKKSDSSGSVSAYVDKLISADYNFRININKLTYKKIIAESLLASLILKNNAVQFNGVSMHHLGIAIDEGAKHKFYGFRVNNLDCDIQKKENSAVLGLDVNLDCIVQALTFNPEKGPFLENKSVQGRFRLLFNKKLQELDFNKIQLIVDQQPFIFNGKFFAAKEGTPFLLSWETENLSFRKGVSFLSANIKEKLEPYDIEEPITHLTGSLDNSETQYTTPLIHLSLKVENSKVKSPFMDISHASFTATFNNEVVRFRGHDDSNTVIHFRSLQGDFENLNFHSDDVEIMNLIHPRIKTNVVSDFKLDVLNSWLKEDELSFTRGTGKIDLAFSGSLEKGYDPSRQMTGTIELSNANLHYAPRNMQFSPVSGKIRFTGRDMKIEDLVLHSGSSDLTMNGELKNIFYMFDHRSEKYSLDWSISSTRLNLDDFNGFLRPKSKTSETEKTKSAAASEMSAYINQVTSSNFNINLKANQVIYRKFSVDSLRAAIILQDSLIQLSRVALRHGNGHMRLQGFLRNDVNFNFFALETQLSDINVSNLFYIFNNFGFTSLTDKNIHGDLTAHIALQGSLTPNAQLITDDFKSSIQFNLKNGQLIDFPPFAQIHQKFLKKRNLSDVRFADLHDSIEVRGDNITINRMEISSSVLTMFVNGIYNFRTGPDMSIQVPLSNLKANKDSVIVNKGNEYKPGVSIRLRVRRGADGKIDVTWDPFDKANKEMNKNE